MARKLKGMVVKVDLTTEIKMYDEPFYKTIGEDVDGWIEIVRPRDLPEGLVMVVDEEGLIKNKPVNLLGSLFYGHYAPIVGDIVLIREGMTNEGMDFMSLTDAQINFIENILKSLKEDR
ncbi:MAG: DUF3846 domain-containing protein [Ignavibacteria bacterium]|jgi:hypothetical protein|nr:DUF3846 domain-containing protein [Ignavibacteria bacterium]